VDDLGKKVDSLKDALAELKKDIALVNQKLDHHDRKLSEWDGRWWYLVGGVILGLLGLISSLIVAFLKK